MRKLVSAGIGVAALAATLSVAAPAGASPVPAPHAAQVARPGEGLGATASIAAAPKPIGKVHNFTAPAVKGAKV
ncbi:hypothetical protein [Actinomadura roseirufa]|uniref:hypothetical protein n=1 Tax=Actinomadura roseirufa TaxID=2094049 RepID=UPI001040F25A|nr:hypothetical protein [Actinomadura roseirufa]